MTALLNWRVWAAIFLAIGLAASHWKAYTLGEAVKDKEFSAYKLDQAKQALKLVERRDAVTQDLQTKADNSKRAKNEEIARLNTDLATALDSLRSRPERPADDGVVSGNPGTGPVTGGTGAGLYREDGEFLTGEAARAKRVLIDLRDCQAAYGRARQAYQAMTTP